MSRRPLTLEVREPRSGLLDEPFLMHVRGATGASLLWRARLRDDDGMTWRASAPTADALAAGWTASARAGRHAALRSLRPVVIEVRVDADDGRAAARAVRRAVLAPGVRVRRWRTPVRATLHLPAPAAARPAVVLDATADADAAERAALAAPLLASRGVVALAVVGDGSTGRARRDAGDGADAVGEARALLARVPAAAAATEVVTVDDVPLPPGVPVRDEGADAFAARAAAWDALLRRVEAMPRAER